MDIGHKVFAVAHEGVRQSAITGRMGLTQATVNRILRRHAANGTLVQGKSTGLPGRTHLPKTVLCSGWFRGSLHKCSGIDGADE